MAFVGVRGGGGPRFANVSSGPTHRDGFASRANICFCLPFQGDDRKSKRAALKKERIRQFSIWHFEMEDQREEEHVKRRLARKKKRDMLSKLGAMRWLRWLNILTIISCLAGLVITFCSTVKIIGEHTPMYKEKEIYRIVGPLVLVFTLFLFIVATAVKHKLKKKNCDPKPSFSFYYMGKNEKGEQQKVSIRKERRPSIVTNDSGNVEDIDIMSRDKVGITSTTSQPDLVLPRLAGVNERFPWSVVTMTAEDDTNTDMVNSEWRRRQQQRLAWAKTKWMRMDSQDLEESWAGLDTDETVVPLDAGLEGDDFSAGESLTSVAPGGRFEGKASGRAQQVAQLSRDVSVKSQDSKASNYSDFSESALLIKKK